MKKRIAIILENGAPLVAVELQTTFDGSPNQLLDKYAEVYAMRRETLSWGGSIDVIEDPRTDWRARCPASLPSNEEGE